jgi:hypothetical protein
LEDSADVKDVLLPFSEDPADDKDDLFPLSEEGWALLVPVEGSF